jgi:uncharacterized protein YaaQ
MKNVIALQKDEDGNIICRQLTQKGKEYAEEIGITDEGYWEDGGTILLEEIDEILDREI